MDSLAEIKRKSMGAGQIWLVHVQSPCTVLFHGYHLSSCRPYMHTFFLPKSKSLALKCTSSGSGAPMAAAHALAMPSNVTKRSPLMLNTCRAALGLPTQAWNASARSLTCPNCVTCCRRNRICNQDMKEGRLDCWKPLVKKVRIMRSERPIELSRWGVWLCAHDSRACLLFAVAAMTVGNNGAYELSDRRNTFAW